MLADVVQYGFDVSTVDRRYAVDLDLEPWDQGREQESSRRIELHDGRTLMPVFENFTLALSPGFLPMMPSGSPTRPLTPTM